MLLLPLLLLVLLGRIRPIPQQSGSCISKDRYTLLAIPSPGQWVIGVVMGSVVAKVVFLAPDAPVTCSIPLLEAVINNSSFWDIIGEDLLLVINGAASVDGSSGKEMDTGEAIRLRFSRKNSCDSCCSRCSWSNGNEEEHAIICCRFLVENDLDNDLDNDRLSCPDFFGRSCSLMKSNVWIVGVAEDFLLRWCCWISSVRSSDIITAMEESRANEWGLGASSFVTLFPEVVFSNLSIAIAMVLLLPSSAFVVACAVVLFLLLFVIFYASLAPALGQSIEDKICILYYFLCQSWTTTSNYWSNCPQTGDTDIGTWKLRFDLPFFPRETKIPSSLLSLNVCVFHNDKLREPKLIGFPMFNFGQRNFISPSGKWLSWLNNEESHLITLPLWWYRTEILRSIRRHIQKPHSHLSRATRYAFVGVRKRYLHVDHAGNRVPCFRPVSSMLGVFRKYSGLTCENDMTTLKW